MALIRSDHTAKQVLRWATNRPQDLPEFYWFGLTTCTTASSDVWETGIFPSELEVEGPDYARIPIKIDDLIAGRAVEITIPPQSATWGPIAGWAIWTLQTSGEVIIAARANIAPGDTILFGSRFLYLDESNSNPRADRKP